MCLFWLKIFLCVCGLRCFGGFVGRLGLSLGAVFRAVLAVRMSADVFRSFELTDCLGFKNAFECVYRVTGGVKFQFYFGFDVDIPL